jgi:hypothetical protein
MDIRELAKVIDRTGDLAVYGSGGELHVAVTIANVNPHHGRVDYLVTPIAGYGERWVVSDSVTLHETETATAAVVGQVGPPTASAAVVGQIERAVR